MKQAILLDPLRTVFLTLPSCSSHPSSSSVGEHGSTPKGPDKKQRRPSAQDLVTKPPEAKQKLEWIEQQPPSAQGQAAKPPKAKRNLWEWVKQQLLPAQDQAANPPEAKRNLWEWVQQKFPSAQDQAANPPKAQRNLREWVEQHYPEVKGIREWVEQPLPSRYLKSAPLEKFLKDKHGDQYFVLVCLSFPRVLLFVAPVSPLLDAI